MTEKEKNCQRNYKKYYPIIVGKARRFLAGRTNIIDCEDMANEVILRLYRRGIITSKSCGRYIYLYLLYIMTDIYRIEVRKTEFNCNYDSVIVDNTDDERLFYQWLISQYAGMEFKAYYIDNLTIAEIARKHNKTIDTVKVLLSRQKKDFKKKVLLYEKS